MWPPSSWYCIKLVIGTSGTNCPFAFPKFFAIPNIQIYKTWNFNLIFLIKKIKKIKKRCITSGSIFKSWRENMGQINRGMVFRSLYYPHIFEHYYYWNKYAITLAPVGTCESIDLTHCPIRRSHKLICSKYQSHGILHIPFVSCFSYILVERAKMHENITNVDLFVWLTLGMGFDLLDSQPTFNIITCKKI